MIKKMLAFFLLKSIAFTGEVNIAAASDLKFALADIVKAYEATNKEERVKTTFGASGKLTTQIANGAPFDLFFAADISYPLRLKEGGFIVGEVKPYAIGRVVLLTKKGSGIDVKQGLSIALDEKVKKIAIANPDVAPYGKAAMECLKNLGVYDKVSAKIVKGENAQQAAIFGVTGAAELALTAHSLALQPAILKEVEYYLIPATAHKKMVQAYAIIKTAESNPSAKKFLSFFEGKDGGIILKKYGFTLE